jgi:hypothetical protein
MKTNQELTRKMGDFSLMQRTKDGMFNATDLLKQWNASSGQQKQINHYFENDSTKEFIKALFDDEVKERKSVKINISDIYTKKRGITGGTWMSPLLFIDFAMWLNPAFKVKVLRFVYDELIKFRNEAGDSYREMAASIQKIVPKKEITYSVSHVAKAINHIVYGVHEPKIRNKQADEVKMKELAGLENDIAMLINRGFIKSFDKLIEHLRILWKEKYMPKELS